MFLGKDDKRTIIELICNEQTRMIVKDNTKYESDKYKKLEHLKIKVKDMEIFDANKMVKNFYHS